MLWLCGNFFSFFPWKILTSVPRGAIIMRSKKYRYGLVAQLGAHHIRIVGVVGSNPIWSTKKRHDRRSCLFLDSTPLRGASPFGDCTCSGRVNRPCAKVLLRKTLGTPDFRRVWTPVYKTHLRSDFIIFTAERNSAYGQFCAALRIDVPLGTAARRRLFWALVI